MITKEIQQVLNDIMVRLNSKLDMQKVVQVRRVLILIWIVNVIANGAFFVWNDIDIELYDMFNEIKKRNESVINKEIAIALLKEVLWAIYGFGWLISGVLFLIHICFANYLVEKEILSGQNLSSLTSVLLCPDILNKDEAMFNMFARMDGTCKQYATLAAIPRRTLLRLYTSLQTITCLQQQVNHHLGLLPFFWLCELFLSTCLRITQVALLAGVRPSGNSMTRLDKSIKLQIEYHLEYFVEYLVLTVFYISFIALVEYFASQRVTLFQLESSLFETVEGEARLLPSYPDVTKLHFPEYFTRNGCNARKENQLMSNCTLVLLTLAISRKYSKRYLLF